MRTAAERAKREGLAKERIEMLRKQARLSWEAVGALSHATTSSLFNLGNELRFESRHVEAASVYRQLVALYRIGGFAGLKPDDLWCTLNNLSTAVAASSGHFLAAADAMLDALCARFQTAVDSQMVYDKSNNRSSSVTSLGAIDMRVRCA
eukprot:SAG31_NODE_20786_length_565_cov_1.133047_2_plen_149_part_01